MPKSFNYGGQAVIEGVLIRGRDATGLAVRCPDGRIWTGLLHLNKIYNGKLRDLPIIRGVLILIETLMLGIRALNKSAAIAMANPESTFTGDNYEEHLSRAEQGTILGSMVIALVIGIGVFFLLPLIGVRSLDQFIASSVISNLFEGLIRLALLVGYIWAVGHIKEIQRVFAYHGAEHMTIHAHEHGVPLNPAEIARFPRAHPRCGTAFLLTVVLISIVIFAIIGRPSLPMAIASRIFLVPVIAGISYEFIRLSGAHSQALLARALMYPGLLLQSLTTRKPDEHQIEVAIAALNFTLDHDTGTSNNIARNHNQ